MVSLFISTVKLIELLSHDNGLLIKISILSILDTILFIHNAVHRLGELASDFVAIVGEHDTSDPGDGVVKNVLSFNDHPQYRKPPYLDFDFSVITLEANVNLGPRVVPVCLPPATSDGPSNKYAGEILVVSGWGALGTGKPSPNKLQRLDVQGITNQECGREQWQDENSIADNIICATVLGPSGDITPGGQEICQGDSGGKYLNFPNISLRRHFSYMRIHVF